MRAFVKLRELLEYNEELNRKFTAVISKLAEQSLPPRRYGKSPSPNSACAKASPFGFVFISQDERDLRRKLITPVLTIGESVFRREACPCAINYSVVMRF